MEGSRSRSLKNKLYSMGVKGVSPGIEKMASSSSLVTKYLHGKTRLIRNPVNSIELQLGGVKSTWDC